MMMNAALVLAVVLPAVLAAPAQDQGKIWAVLVAGSNTYDNYRHQADVCHAYQIFRKNGIPDSQIITMMYDDIAHNSENPKKGKIINHIKGPNVYANILKDYTGNAVNVKNFVNVLTGNSSAIEDGEGVNTKKVLASGPNDHVFVNFVDHGAADLIGFPTDYMYASQLIPVLKKMHKNNMFKKLVFYLEACESGSMFQNLPKNIEIYAATAANAEESSYACYYDDALETYLGDEFSVSWMEDIDSEEAIGTFSSETLFKQYQNVVKNVNESHPKMFGQKSINKDDATDFFGNVKKTVSYTSTQNGRKFKDSVSSRDVPVQTLKNRILNTNDLNKKKELQKKLDILVKGRHTVDQLFTKILSKATNMEGHQLMNWEKTHTSLTAETTSCYETLVDNFNNNCVNINKNTYALGHLYKLANLCALDIVTAEDVLEVYNSECSDSHRAMVGVN